MKQVLKAAVLGTVAVLSAGAAPLADATPTGSRSEPGPLDPSMGQAGNYVAFGDSFPANPGHTDDWNGTGAVGRGACKISQTNIGHLVAEDLGLQLRDHSCNGAVVYMPSDNTLNSQVDAAVGSGDLDGDTRLVTIFIGGNDAGRTFWAPGEIQDREFAASFATAMGKIRDHAPNSNVLVVGYPEFSSPDGLNYACPVNIFGNAPRVPAAPVRIVEDNLQRRQHDAAMASGATFVDMKETANVDVAMCGAEGERLMSAFVDTDITNYNQPTHLTMNGSRVFADSIIAAHQQ